MKGNNSNEIKFEENKKGGLIMNKDYEDELENDDRTDDEYANGYLREDYTCADCIYSDCDGNQLCDLFEPW